MPSLADVSDIFIFFFGSGRGKGESEAAGRGGGRIFIENPRRGGGSPGGGTEGPGGVCSELGIFLGGGLNIFFRGRNVQQASDAQKSPQEFLSGECLTPLVLTPW